LIVTRQENLRKILCWNAGSLLRLIQSAMRKAPMSVRFVMDISVVMLWRFEDERNGSAEAISRKREKAYHRGGRSEDIAERVDDGHSVRYE